MGKKGGKQLGSKLQKMDEDGGVASQNMGENGYSQPEISG
jgi:hypothetical protein